MYDFIPTPSPSGTHRDDMQPITALYECYELWGAGCWRVDNAQYDLEEVMSHLAKLFRQLSIKLPSDGDPIHCVECDNVHRPPTCDPEPPITQTRTKTTT